MNKIDVLFYMHPWNIDGGSSTVAYYLTRALTKKVNLTRFPSFNFGYPINVIRVYKRFLKKDFDIVHFNLAPTIIQYYRTTRWVDGNYLMFKHAKGRGAHTVMNIHGIIPLESEHPENQRFLALKTLDAIRACEKVDKIIVNTKHMQSKAIVWYGAEKEKIEIIPNGVDLDMFNVQNNRLILDGDPAILFVGHLLWVKGIDILLDAMVEVKSVFPKVRLHLLGGELQNDVNPHSLVKQKGLEEIVIFHGAVPHAVIPYYFKSATLCVLPSRHEGFGIAMLEAMASGTPFVASDIESFREILKDNENSLFFKSGDSASLSEALIRLCADSDLRAKISQAASKTIVNFSWDKIAERYVSVYKSLC
jgi:glycosyltransferase involved in cell wall biosynthesis